MELNKSLYYTLRYREATLVEHFRQTSYSALTFSLLIYVHGQVKKSKKRFLKLLLGSGKKGFYNVNVKLPKITRKIVLNENKKVAMLSLKK